MSFEHKFLIGQEYSNYANLDTLEGSVNFNYWRVDLLHADTYIQVVQDVMTLTKDIIDTDTGNYRWYTSFTLPTVPNNCYRFAIIDTADNDYVKYLSDPIEIVNSTDGLILCKYRNAVNILNYNYATLTSFYNVAHVELLKRKPATPINTGGYNKADGSFFRVRTVRTKTYEFVTGWFDEDEHDATNTMIFHNDLQLAIDGIYTDFNFPEDGSYDPAWEENYEYIQVAFRLEQDNQSTSNKAL